MKKLMLYMTAIVCLTGFSLNAWAYTITVTDPVGDQIGDRIFDTFSILYTVNEALQITIGTNYPSTGYLVGSWQTYPADLLLDGAANGPGWDYAIPLVTHDGFVAGRLYQIGSMAISNEFEPVGDGYTYNKNVPVWLKTGVDTGYYGTWQWTTAGTDPDYYIGYLNMNWWWTDANPPGDYLRIGWATSNCANDVVNVPEPGILILLGIAMSAIGMASWRIRKI
jgi:hypothetical protein